MATTIKKYISKCDDIVKAEPAYVYGKSSLTECDCIGMPKYSFRECGVSFSTTGTNYSARKQVDNLHKISSASNLHIGDVVFKAREPGDSGYDLPSKYRVGGAEYNGDLRDYYHIGTVKSVNPLQIIHMTSPTAKTDTKIGKWGFVAQWKKEYIDDIDPVPAPEPEPVPEPEPAEPKYMVVYAENGKPVNMRVKPYLNAALVDRVPVGGIIEWLKEDGAWAYIKYGNRYGWMLDCYLVDEYTPTPDPDEDVEPEPDDPSGEELTVWAENGRPVKLRAKPSTSCKLYDEIPCGETVILVSAGNEWCKVNYGKRNGWYMMTKFLSRG